MAIQSMLWQSGDDSETIMHTYAHVLPGMQTEMVNTIEQLYDDPKLASN
jgi:hypothetical protein